jgi:hypothetical protein
MPFDALFGLLKHVGTKVMGEVDWTEVLGGVSA